MIAVFTSTREEFEQLNLTPKHVFVRITHSEMLRGRKFTGVIDNGVSSSGSRDAYSELWRRQPEIFKK